MKMLDELYKEIQSNDALKEEFLAALKNHTAGTFLREHGCDASVSEVMEFIKGMKSKAISDDDLDNVAGGCSSETGGAVTECCNTDNPCHTTTEWCDISC